MLMSSLGHYSLTMWVLSINLIACANLEGTIKVYTVAASSCLGEMACANNTGTVLQSACIGENACHSNRGNIGFHSCDGLVRPS